MSEQLRESVSALMDGEADELELRRLLSEVSSEQRQIADKTWSRYHLVRDVIQSKDQDLPYRHLDISEQVSAAISSEHSEPSVAFVEKPAASWFKPTAGFTVAASVAMTAFKPAAGFAIAASVAMAVIVGVQNVNSVNPGLNPATPPALASSSRVYPVQGSSMQASGGSAGGTVNYRNTELPGSVALSRAAADLEAQKRLEKYLLRHTEQAALNNGQGMISYARVANFETE